MPKKDNESGDASIEIEETTEYEVNNPDDFNENDEEE